MIRTTPTSNEKHTRIISDKLEEVLFPRNRLIILTNDPSIRGWGWVVIENGVVLDCGCIKTEPKAKKLRTRKGDDNIRRINEINTSLLSIIETYGVNYLISELPHGSQSASAAATIGMCLGIIQTISDCKAIGVEYYSEGDAKMNLLGKRAAEKDETIQAIKKLYKISWKGTKYIDEAVADAMAVYHVATRQSATLKLFKK